MKRVALLTSVVALAAAMGSAPSIAQMQPKGGEGPANVQGAPGGQSQTQQPAQQKEQAPARQGAGKAEPGEKSTKGAQQSEPKAPKGSAEKSAEPKDKGTKGTAEKATEPKDKGTKGTAEKMEPKDKGTKGTAEKMEPKDKGTKGAEKGMAPDDKGTKGTAQKGTEPKDKAKTAEPKDKAGTGGRVQVSEQQRTSLTQTFSRETRINRVTNVNFSINVGTRVPRTVRLVALPASVIAIVPGYRSYRYFAIDDRICIVDPATYEIVEVITISDQTAARSGPGPARLVLTDEERLVILSEVDMSDGSTLALGSLSEGAEVPRGVQVRAFPSTIVQKVPKVKDYKFFTAENRLAIVDPQGSKVQLVIEQRR
jgi:Protein of unknown function (DUF1236)